MKNRTSLIIATLLASMLSSCSRQSPADKALRGSLSIERLPHYKADFELLQPGAGTNQTTHGILYGDIAPDRSALQRRELITGMMGANAKTTTIVSHGKLYQMLPDEQSAIEIPAGAGIGEQVGMDGVLTDRRYFKLEMRSQAEQGRQFNVLVLTFLEPFLQIQRTTAQQAAKQYNLKMGPPVIATQERWVDAKNNLTCQINNYDADRQLISAIKYSNIQTNADLSSNLFELPKGVTIIKATNSSQIIQEVVKHGLGHRGDK